MPPPDVPPEEMSWGNLCTVSGPFYLLQGSLHSNKLININSSLRFRCGPIEAQNWLLSTSTPPVSMQGSPIPHHVSIKSITCRCSCPTSGLKDDQLRLRYQRMDSKQSTRSRRTQTPNESRVQLIHIFPDVTNTANAIRSIYRVAHLTQRRTHSRIL